ncbi:signal transduction histidine kinase regulating citrate/malate metabolism [Alkaliphilus metalliredigens QYMF]|uniref:Signal transduction histidine kinase regulating citrate/malate metabolism n=2 Tax=Alkaliphilus TaxID=114627 RepID=A6TU22_ALKMQ|nr:signal transduction histidine kinase regulating citrate/malate metabolism [Alkaliphilus metalliredigens QYMF]
MLEYLKYLFVNIMENAITFIILCHFAIPWKENRGKVLFSIAFMGILPTFSFMHQYEYRMFLTHINCIIWIKFLFRKTIKDTVVQFYTTFVLGILVHVPLLYVTAFFMPINNNKAIPYKFFVVNISIFLVIIVILCRLIPLKKLYKKYIPILEKFFPFLLSTALIIYLLNTLFLLDVYTDFSIYFLVVTLFALITFTFIQVMVEDKEEKILIKSYEQQESLVSPLIEDIRSKQHDFKNHITTIYGFSQQSTSDVIQNIQIYIESLNKHLIDIDTFLHINNKVISGILYSKLCEAELKNIDLQYKIPPYDVPFPLADYEYVSVLGNLLDNALEVPMKADNEKKKIIFKLIDDANSSVLEIWNNGTPINSKDMSDLFRKGYSTKENKSQRGYGLYNVKRIVDKYNGNIEILTQNNLTGFRICFPQQHELSLA